MVTGATGGLGRSFCVACARRGFALYMTDVSAGRLGALEAGLRGAYGAETRSSVCDMTDARSRDALYREIARSGIRFSGLINVAGTDIEGLFTSLGLEDIRTIMQLNMCAAAENIRSILPYIRESSRFIIINVASQAAFQPMPFKALYAAGKRFLLQLSLALREELRDRGITVTALCPSGMPTTAECVAAIDAQGFIGALTARNTGDVAEAALRGALRGRAVVVPGATNRLIWALTTLMPQTLSARYVCHRWGGARTRRIAAAEVPEPATPPPEMYGAGGAV
jgi:short-subunit dehydrogenase